MKNTEFLKENLISNKGFYDNKIIFENTLESFEEAMKYNYTLHLKVRLTKDKVLVVYSDNNLTRLMNLKDKISTTTYDELNFLSSYHIPTLEEVLDVVNGKVPLIINPRSLDYKYYLEKELVKLLDNYRGSFAIVNSNACIIKWFNKNAPDYIVGEILAKSGRIYKLALSNIIANFSIVTDFKSINLDDYDIIKIKKIKEDSLVIGYLADTSEKYDNYKDVFNNLFVEKKIQ